MAVAGVGVAVGAAAVAVRVQLQYPHLCKPVGQVSVALFHRGSQQRRRPMSVALARRRSSESAGASARGKKSLKKDRDEVDDLDVDALEALFSQLEEDLKNDNLAEDDFDGELTEEDLARLEQELEEAFAEDDIIQDSNIEDDKNEHEEVDEDEEEDEDEPIKLKTWQLRRLASALKAGKRKTSIKSLAGELGLDRALVLELLRDPPPNLLLMSASLPEKVQSVTPEPDIKTLESEGVSDDADSADPEVVAEPILDSNTPVFVMQGKWFAKKRLKKAQIGTLERVYGRTKRPTNTMINNIVHLTNLPRKVVIKWFEDKRGDDGVPDQRIPFRRKVPDVN